MHASGTRGLLSQPARLGGMLGIAFIVLFIVGVLIQGSPPVASDPPDEIRAFFIDNRDSYLISDFLLGIAIVCLFLPFAICLHSLLAQADGEPGIMPTLFLAGTILVLSLGFAGSIAWGTLAMAAGDETVDDSFIKAMMYMAQYTENGISAAFALTALAGSIVMLKTAVPARWTGYVGLTAFALNIIGSAWVIDGDDEGVLAILMLLGLLLFAIWILTTSIMLLRLTQPESIAAEPAAA